MDIKMEQPTEQIEIPKSFEFYPSRDIKMEELLKPFEIHPSDKKHVMVSKCDKLNTRTYGFTKFYGEYLRTCKKRQVFDMLIFLYDLCYKNKVELKEEPFPFKNNEIELKDTNLLFLIALKTYENKEHVLLYLTPEEKKLYWQTHNYYPYNPYPSLKKFFKKNGRLPSIKSKDWDEALCAYLHKTYLNEVCDRKLIKYFQKPHTFNY